MVSVANGRVEHEVRLQDFTKWLEKPGGSPREVSDRKRLREILGMTATRSVWQGRVTKGDGASCPSFRTRNKARIPGAQ